MVLRVCAMSPSGEPTYKMSHRMVNIRREGAVVLYVYIGPELGVVRPHGDESSS